MIEIFRTRGRRLSTSMIPNRPALLRMVAGYVEWEEKSAWGSPLGLAKAQCCRDEGDVRVYYNERWVHKDQKEAGGTKCGGVRRW